MLDTSSDHFSVEILKLFPVWEHEGLAPLTTIIGYTTLLLDPQFNNLTEQQKQFIMMIQHAAQKASATWRDPGYYIMLSLNSQNLNWRWGPVKLSEVCDEALSSSFKYINRSNVYVEISAGLAPVRADPSWLSVAITNLLEPSVGYLYNTEFKSSVSANKTDDKHLLVKIRTGLKLSLDENYNSIESISYPGNNLSVASIIIEKHGSQLEFSKLINDGDDNQIQGTEFRFVLPLWQ